MAQPTTFKRDPHWQRLLAEYIDSVRHDRFAWGSHDCGMHVGGAIRAITGSDPAAEWRGKYDSALSARRLMGCGIEDMPEKIGLTPLVSVKFARVGDVVSFPQGGHLCLGVCHGVSSSFVGEKGLEFFPTSKCSKAWRV